MKTGHRGLSARGPSMPGELLGVDHVLEGVSASDMDSVAHAYVVAPAIVFRCRPMPWLPLATSAHRVLLCHQSITVKFSVVTL